MTGQRLGSEGFGLFDVRWNERLVVEEFVAVICIMAVDQSRYDLRVMN